MYRLDRGTTETWVDTGCRSTAAPPPMRIHQTHRHEQDRCHEIPLPGPARQASQPAHRPREDASLHEAWLIAERPPGAKEPTDYWLSDLPADTPTRTLVRLAKIRWRIEHDYRELKTGLGLSHFEGRSFPGFHHHVTLVSAAHLFITRKCLATPKAAGAA
jgi:hypothetical protein